MQHFPVFLSVVIVVRNQAELLEEVLSAAIDHLAHLVDDYELIVVDNASIDDSLSVYDKLTSDQNSGLPNLQVYSLIKEVVSDAATWVGLENSLGDFVAVIDPFTEDISLLPQLLERSVGGADVVFAYNEIKPIRSIGYKLANLIFNRTYKFLSGIDLAREAPKYRVLSKQVINYILQHPQPAVTYRHLPATGGFVRASLKYRAEPAASQAKYLADSIEFGIRLLVSTTNTPMRMVNTLCLVGAVANFAYSIFVILSLVFVPEIEPGWASLSLQQSGMFFLISLVLLVIGEYILNMASLFNSGPLYHVAKEFTSARITRREKLNVEEIEG